MADNPAVRALRVPAFRRYFVGQLPSVTGSWAQVVALSWVVVELDPSALGWVVAVQFMPSLLLGPWFGAVADRYDRRALLMLAETGLGLVALAFAAAAAAGALTLPLVFLLASIWGVTNALDTPARRALVPMLVPRELASSAAALTGMAMLLGMTAGAALGALLIGTAGPGIAFATNAVTFFADVALLGTIRVGVSPRIARAPGQIREGLLYVWRTPTLRTALLTLGVVATLGFSVQVSVPIFVRVAFDGGPSLVGIAVTAVTSGSLLGAGAAAVRGEPGPLAIARASLGMAAGLSITAIASHVPVALVGLAVVGFAWSLLFAAVIATLQAADASMTGRVMSTLSVVLLGGLAVGGPIASALAGLAGPRTPLALGALAALGAAAFIRAAGRRRPSPRFTAARPSDPRMPTTRRRRLSCRTL